jgi:two-component system chemotaxis response regulator CheB
MDVLMPRLDGFAAAREIMAAAPTPIVLLSSTVDVHGSAVVLEAIRSGAMVITGGLPPAGDPSYPQRRGALVQMVRSMSRVRMSSSDGGAAASIPTRRVVPGKLSRSPCAVEAIGVVASAGGPAAFAKLLTALPRDGIPPILLVQHFARGCLPGLASWLTSSTGYPTEVAAHGAAMQAGRVYIAPDDRHLGLTSTGLIALSDDRPIGHFRPSGTYLLRSIAAALGPRALGVILTGMGDDGADGALDLRRAGGRVAAQDEATCTVFGMPRAAVERGAVIDVLPIEAIAPWICSSVEAPACMPS